MKTKKIIYSALVSMFMLPLVSSAATQTYNVECVQSAIEDRDVEIGDAWGVYSSSIHTALSQRTTALKAAWAIVDDPSMRRAARKTAWDSYENAHNVARTQLSTSRKAIWEQYHKDMAACGVTVRVEASQL